MQSCRGQTNRNAKLQSTSLFPVSKSPSPTLPVSLTWLLFHFPFPLSPFPFPQQFKKSISPNLERSWRDEGKNWFPVPKLCFFCLMVVIRDKNYLGILWIWVYLLVFYYYMICCWVFFQRRSGAALLCIHLCSVSSCILACFGVADSVILHKQRSNEADFQDCTLVKVTFH